MKLIPALGILLSCWHSAQGQNNAGDTAFCTTTLGINYRPLQLAGLNRLMALGAFPAINTEWTILDLSREIESAKAPEWSAWISASLGYQGQRKEWPRSVSASLSQISLGVGHRIWKNGRISLIAKSGLDFITLSLHCYDRLIDTTNLAGYITAPESDAKKMVCTQPCLRTALMLRRVGRDNTMINVSSGYLIPLQAVNIGHYRGDFGALPATRLGGFYIGAEFGFAKRRCIVD